MRTMTTSPLALAALAFFGLAPLAHAQSGASAVLNEVEVRQLAVRPAPGDHSRLARHFAVLADQYANEAERHTKMTHSDGNPSRQIAMGKSPHCHDLAKLNNASARVARQLGTHHLNLAKGLASTPPDEAARFERGEGARAATAAEINVLSAEALTAADHRAIEEHFIAKADRYTRRADEHATLAQTYRGTRLAAAAVHQDRLAALARASATDADNAAAQHKQLAESAR